MIHRFLSICLFLLGILNVEGQIQMNLNQCLWQGSTNNGAMQFQSQVPFNVHTDLFQHHFINDPYIGNNEQALQWISDSTWVYECTFDTDAELLKNEQIELVLDNPDTYCKVFVNGHLMGNTNNQFISWRFNCKQFLQQRKNLLKLVFEPLNIYQKASTKKLPIEAYAVHRKSAYQFGWDWGPRFLTFGLRNCYIQAFNNFKFLSLHQNQVFNKDASVDLELNLHYLGDEKSNLHFKLSCLSDSNIVLAQSKPTQFKGNEKVLQFKVHIINPKLWWTTGLGLPNLYHFQLKVEENSRVAFEKNIDIGIRKLELIQEPDLTGNGKSFYFKLNGIPVFMKGANLVPPSSFMNSLPIEHYAHLTEEAQQMHMNMIRVWGGGTYLPHEFYEACNQKGILVWQDLMFAGSMYPVDSNMVQSIQTEVQEQVHQLQLHPCLALICGNNEISEAWFNWGWQTQYAINETDSLLLIQQYKWLFEKAIPNWISEIAPEMYWPSSPAFGWGRKQSYLEGDSHYWGVWWGEAPFSAYQNHVGRFVSEFGFQGMPDARILKKYMLSDAVKIDSIALKNHQKHKRGFELIQNYMQQHFKIPKDLESYSYTSQLLQAEGLKMAIESHRNKMPYCMGSLVWQLNDCWPVSSWSLVDFENNRKAAFYQVKRSFAPTLISITQSKDTLHIHFLDERPSHEKGLLGLRILDFKGNILYTCEDSILNNNQVSKPIYNLALHKLSDLLKDSNQLVLEATYSSATKCTRALHYFCEPKNLQLQNSEINCQIIAPNKLRLVSNVLQKNVCIYSSKQPYKLSDNFFDLLPKQAIEIELELGSFIENPPLLMSLNQLKF